MDDTDFDRALIAAAFTQASLTGWRNLSIVEAAQSAGLPLDRARTRFPGPAAVLMRFGLMADQAALAEPVTEPRPRDRLFDLLMRRIDVLQAHRDGMVALLDILPTTPALSLALGGATLRSMAWMLEAAGVSATGFRGMLRAQGLVGVWVYVVRAWKDDTSADLAGTMAALDKALDQAERVSSMLGLDGGETSPAPAEMDGLEGVVDVPADPGPDVPPPPPPPEMPPPSPAV
jgi:ubiquinone biosynthesis protein COQ9